MSSYLLARKIAIVPIYLDTDSAVNVLSRFERGTVDEICIVADRLDQSDMVKLQRATDGIATPVRIIDNKELRGVGYAIKQGLKYAQSKGYDVVVVMAGNDKDDPVEIPRLLKPILEEDYDYVQGSRFLPGGKHVKNPFLRMAFSRLFPFAWTLATGVRCTDVTNGFRAYKMKILQDSHINIWQNWLDSYQLEYYIHYKVTTLGYKMKEVPVSKTYPFRHKGGYSRISPFRDWWKIVEPIVYLTLGIKD
jgi:dolichol-phosphate mannosyltransferase